MLLISILNFPINILRKILTVRPSYIFLESNHQSANLSNKERKKAFFINSFDYSEYLRINKKKNKKKDLVFIDSEIKPGHLVYSDTLIPGKTKKEILLSTY